MYKTRIFYNSVYKSKGIQGAKINQGKSTKVFGKAHRKYKDFVSCCRESNVVTNNVNSINSARAIYSIPLKIANFN